MIFLQQKHYFKEHFYEKDNSTLSLSRFIALAR